MKIKAIKAGSISFGGAVISVSEGQEFPCDDTFGALVDLYVDMFEKVEDKEVKKTEKAPKVEVKPVEQVELVSSTVIDVPEAEVAPVKEESFLDKAKKFIK